MTAAPTLSGAERDGPDLLPLAPFLTSLERDGIRITLRDHERIHLALRARGPWTVTRLRVVLIALLAQDKEQAALLGRRFDAFFETGDANQQNASDQVAIDRVMADLQLLAEVPRRASTGPRLKQRRLTRELVAPARRWNWGHLLWCLVVGTVLSVFGIRAWLSPVRVQSPADALRVSPQSLVFGTAELGQALRQTLEIRNDSESSINVHRHKMEGIAAPEFRIVDSSMPDVLAPGAPYLLTFEFVPQEVGLRSVRFDVHHSGPSGVIEVELRGAGVSGEKAASSAAMRTYKVPVVRAVHEVEDPQVDSWKTPLAVAAILFLAQLFYGVWLWWQHRPPDDQAPALNPEGPRLFRSASIGGDPVPWLDKATLDDFADFLGYFRSQETSHKLDVKRSIEATGRGGGLPRLVFEHRKKIRRVLVLEDALAEARRSNPVAGELAQGLLQRGVPVLHGVFSGSPARYRTSDGVQSALEDLENERHSYLLLIFSDGKGLTHRHDSFTLERLSLWPQVVWMELREQRAWDESTALVARHGLHVYPASCKGMMRALGRFATEQGPTSVDLSQPHWYWRGGPAAPASQLESHDLERLLGDALSWAEHCAMMVPPLSLGLADALRREFSPEVPPERVERLWTLPGVTASAAGLRFSQRLLAILRRQFLARNSEERQRQVIEFLMDVVREAEPEERDSLAHHAWEWKLERLRLEVAPDRALQRIAELERGPLKDLIRGDFADVKITTRIESPNEIEAPEAVPLRARPTSRRGLQRLLRLAPKGGVRQGEAFPVSNWHAAALAILGVGWFLFVSYASFASTRPRSIPVLRWNIASGGNEGVLLLDIWRGRWESFASMSLATSIFPELEPGRDYRVRLRGVGQEAHLETSYPLHTIAGSVELEIEEEDREVPCHEAFGSVEVYRCSQGGNVPRRLKDHTKPVLGLEIRSPSESADRMPIGELLLGSGMIDRLYVAYLFPHGDPVDLTHVESDSAPWLDRGRLIWWTDVRIVSVELSEESSETPEESSPPTQLKIPRLPVPFTKTTVLGPITRLTPEVLAQKLPEIKSMLVSQYPQSFGYEVSGCKFEISAKATPDTGTAPLSVELSVEISPELECHQSPYARWDIDGDGVFEMAATTSAIKPSTLGVVTSIFEESTTARVEVRWGDVKKEQDVEIRIVDVGPECRDFRPNPSTIVLGGTSQLTWKQTGGVRALLSGEPSYAVQAVDLDKPITLAPLETTSYELRIFDESGQSGSPCQTTLTVYSGRQAGEQIVEESIEMALRYIPPGRFMMGSPPDEVGRFENEGQRQVELTRGFWIGETEVTQGQWQQLMASNPSKFKNCGLSCPVERVSWFDAVEFANRLSKSAGLPSCYILDRCVGRSGVDLECGSVLFKGIGCTGYRLPTEAEWEYAARADTVTALYTGPLNIVGYHHGPELDEIGWYGGNSGVNYGNAWPCSDWLEKQFREQRTCGTHPVAESLDGRTLKSPNGWGLYDVLGNVYEWTWDSYEFFGVSDDVIVDPLGSDQRSRRVNRGCSWDSAARYCRVSRRANDPPNFRIDYLGFRLARTAE